jgi:hypothetical protein
VSTPEIVGIVIVVILIAALVAATVRIAATRRGLRERFGPEYDRAVTEQGGRAAAEAELRRRERRHESLPLRQLNSEQLTAYQALWTEIQARFVDDPVAAVRDADRLVARIVADRGYPAVEYPDRLSHLSVDHARVLDNYRSAHDVSVRNDAGQATTEELRQAMVDFRAIVGGLLGQHLALPTPESGSDLLDEPAASREADPRNADTAYRDDTATTRSHDAGQADTHNAVDPAFDENGERVLDPTDQSQPPATRPARRGR